MLRPEPDMSEAWQAGARQGCGLRLHPVMAVGDWSAPLSLVLFLSSIYSCLSPSVVSIYPWGGGSFLGEKAVVIWGISLVNRVSGEQLPANAHSSWKVVHSPWLYPSHHLEPLASDNSVYFIQAQGFQSSAFTISVKTVMRRTLSPTTAMDPVAIMDTYQLLSLSRL